MSRRYTSNVLCLRAIFYNVVLCNSVHLFQTPSSLISIMSHLNLMSASDFLQIHIVLLQTLYTSKYFLQILEANKPPESDPSAFYSPVLTLLFPLVATSDLSRLTLVRGHYIPLIKLWAPRISFFAFPHAFSPKIKRTACDWSIQKQLQQRQKTKQTINKGNTAFLLTSLNKNNTNIV